MSNSLPKLLGIIGAGQMGTGIAHVAAQVAKVQVLLCDSNSKILDSQIQNIGIL